jgi:hypothetical protein
LAGETEVLGENLPQRQLLFKMTENQVPKCQILQKQTTNFILYAYGYFKREDKYDGYVCTVMSDCTNILVVLVVRY